MSAMRSIGAGWAGLGVSLLVNAAIAAGLAAHRVDPIAGPTPPPLPPSLEVAVPLPALAKPRAAEDVAATHAAVGSSSPAPPPIDLAAFPLPQMDSFPLPAWPGRDDLPMLPALALITAPDTGTAPGVAAGQRTSAQLLGRLNVERFYPRRARQERRGGQSVIDIDIDSRGQVVGRVLISSEPAGVFDEAAMRLAETLRFVPASRDGQAVPSRVRQTILWNPNP